MLYLQLKNMENNIENTLHSLGLDKKQVNVYLACLELGGATVQELAEKSGVKRTSIYNFLSEMKEKRLFTEIKKQGKTLIIPEDPSVLVEKAKENLKKIEKLLPELKGIFNLPGRKPKVRFYEGEKGVEDAYKDQLITGQTIYAFSDYEKMLVTMDEKYMWDFAKERTKRKIKFYSIAKDSEMAQIVKIKDKEQIRETKIVKDVQFDTEINIYGNKVAMMSFRRPAMAVIIEDIAIAQTLKSIWKSWWKTLK